MAERERQAKPTKADKDAAARAKRIWNALPKNRKPSQDDIADKLDITQGAVSQYLNGKIPFNYLAVIDFARVLGCRPEDIRTDLPEMQAQGRVTEKPPPEWEILRESGWPFTFEAPRYRRLSEEQREQIERVVLTMIEGFEGSNRPKRTKRIALRQ